MNRGTLIAFEGLDGCGKSTQARVLAEALRAAGRDVLLTREPSDGPTGQRLRELARADEPLPPDEELRLFVEDRRWHVREVLEPALAAGKVAVTDRYFLSTVAYQGARGLDWRDLLAASEDEFPHPHLVLLLEVDPERGLARVESRGAHREHAFERPERLARVAEIFDAIDRPYLARIDGEPDVEGVASAIRDCVRERLGI